MRFKQKKGKRGQWYLRPTKGVVSDHLECPVHPGVMPEYAPGKDQYRHRMVSQCPRCAKEREAERTWKPKMSRTRPARVQYQTPFEKLFASLPAEIRKMTGVLSPEDIEWWVCVEFLSHDFVVSLSEESESSRGKFEVEVYSTHKKFAKIWACQSAAEARALFVRRIHEAQEIETHNDKVCWFNSMREDDDI